MFCPSCGKQLPDNANFCTGCGNMLTPKTPAVHEQEEPTFFAPPAPLTPPVHKPAAAPAPARQPAQKKSSMKTVTLVLIIALAAALVTVILIFGYMLISEFSAQETPKTPSMTIPQYEYEPEDPFADFTAPVSDGNPVPEGNLYRECYDPATGFVLPYSHNQYYSRADLSGLNELELEIAKQEIYARKGQSFNSRDLQEYFDSMSWYPPKSGGSLNNFEQANLALLDIFQRELDGTLYRSSNPYLRYQSGSNADFLAGSDSRYLNASDLEYLTETELTLARNEIFARQGYVFSDPQLQEFFYCKQWYRPSDTFSESNFSDCETANVELIRVYEKIINGGYTPSLGNPYTPYYNYHSEYILLDGSSRLLSEYDLIGYSLEQLCIARNQIIARHGYTFKDQELMEYFLQCSWYHPSTAPGRNDLVSLSSTENKNMNFLAEYEKKLKSMPNLSNLDSSMSYSYTTDFYSITMPAYWEDYCDIEKSGDAYSDQGLRLKFHEKKSQSTAGGHLFTILLLPTAQDYTQFPSYDCLGTITNGTETSWYVVILYPTDVQCEPAYAELYNKMYNDIYKILDSFTPRNGFYFA